MRGLWIADPDVGQVLVLRSQTAQNRRRPVTRAVVAEDQLVAEVEDARNGLLNPNVLIASQDDPHDLRHEFESKSRREPDAPRTL
jgi:hypothetical protein